jgi:hypothetical protein
VTKIIELEEEFDTLQDFDPLQSQFLRLLSQKMNNETRNFSEEGREKYIKKYFPRLNESLKASRIIDLQIKVSDALKPFLIPVLSNIVQDYLGESMN